MKALLCDECTRRLTLVALDPETGKEKRISNSPRYKEFCMGVGWLDPSGDGEYGKHAIVAVGITETDVYEVFVEVQGSLAELVPVMIEGKDALLIDRTFLDTSNEAALRFLRDPETADGLTGYEQEETEHGNMVYVRKSSTWKAYRDRRTYTALVPVDEKFIANPEIVLDTLKSLARQKRFEVRPECPEVARVISKDPPLDNIFRHPLFRATGYAVVMMEKTRDRDDGKAGKEPEPWYDNLRGSR